MPVESELYVFPLFLVVFIAKRVVQLYTILVTMIAILLLLLGLVDLKMGATGPLGHCRSMGSKMPINLPKYQVSGGRSKLKTMSKHVETMVEKLNIHENHLFIGFYCVCSAGC